MLFPLIPQVSLALLSERCSAPSTSWWSWPRSTRLHCWQDSPHSWPSSLSGSSARPSPFPPWWLVRLALLELLECAGVHVAPCRYIRRMKLSTCLLEAWKSSSSLPQEESASRWPCWVPSWEEFWCEGWTSQWKGPASFAQLLWCSVCLFPHLCCSSAAPPRGSVASFHPGSHAPKSICSTGIHFRPWELLPL